MQAPTLSRMVASRGLALAAFSGDALAGHVEHDADVKLITCSRLSRHRLAAAATNAAARSGRCTRHSVSKGRARLAASSPPPSPGPRVVVGWMVCHTRFRWKPETSSSERP